MDQDSLDGFITRKQACEQFDISDRSIGRYLKKAMQKNDAAFLNQFRLITLDDEIIAGPNVSFEVIERLQAEGRVPTWYVSQAWMQRKFTSRNGTAADDTVELHTTVEPKSEPLPSGEETVGRQDSKDEIILLLREQVNGLQEDKRKWEEEKREMREDSRETRKLMNQMQQLMGHMQDRLLPEKTTSRSAEPSEPATDAEVVDATKLTPQKEKGGSRRTRSTSQRRKLKKGSGTSSKKKRSTSTKTATSIWQRDVKDLFPFRKQ